MKFLSRCRLARSPRPQTSCYRVAGLAFAISCFPFARSGLTQTESLPVEPDWPTSSSETTPITLEDDLAERPETPDVPAFSADALTGPNESTFSDPFVTDPGPNPFAPSPGLEPTPPPRDDPALARSRVVDRLTLGTETFRGSEDPIISDGGTYFPDLTNPLDPVFQAQGLKVRLGELHLRIPIGLGLQYDDNIFQSKTNRQADIISTFSPTLLLGVGDFRTQTEEFFVLRYTPQFQFFAENSAQNTTNESLDFAGQYAFPRLTTSTVFSYSRNSNPTADTQGRAERINYAFAWENSYALGAKTFAEAVLNAFYQDDGNSIDYTTVSLSPRIAYQFSEKLRFNLGPAFGTTFVSDGSTQTFQSLILGIDYNTLKKFTFRGSFGIQARQFEEESSESDDLVTPTLSVGTSYLIRPSNAVTLDLARTVGNSSTRSGQSQITNSVRVNYTQRVLTRFVFSLDLRYELREFEADNRDDDTFILARPSLAYTFFREQVTLSVFYERAQRMSETPSLEFDNNTLGLNISLQF